MNVRRRRGRQLLPDALAGQPPAARLRTATVFAVTGAGVTLTISGAQVAGVSRLKSYPAPVIGDVVQVITDSGRYLILGPVL